MVLSWLGRRTFLLLFLVLTLLVCPSNGLSNDVTPPNDEQLSEVSPNQQRRELWDFWSVFMLINPPCPPADAPHQPPHCVKDDSNGYDDDSSGSSSSTYNASESVGSANALGLWTVPLVGSVLAAIVAIAIGSRRKQHGGHRLMGAITRRHGAVSAFADHVLTPKPEKMTEMV